MPHSEQLHFPKKNSAVTSIRPLGVVLYMPSTIPRKYPLPALLKPVQNYGAYLSL